MKKKKPKYDPDEVRPSVTLTDEVMVDFFKEDRFMHYVIRKHGLYFADEDDLQTARYYAIRRVTLHRGDVFENSSHLNSFMEWTMRGGHGTMMQMKTQKKRAELEVYPESSFIMGENETSILETRQPMQQESFDILDDAKASLSPQLYQIIEMTFSGYSNVEIAAAQGVTTQAIYDRKKKAVKHLRLYYEIDAPINKGHEPKIRSRTRSNATDTYKAETRSHTEAMSYLGLA